MTDLEGHMILQNGYIGQEDDAYDLHWRVYHTSVEVYDTIGVFLKYLKGIKWHFRKGIWDYRSLFLKYLEGVMALKRYMGWLEGVYNLLGGTYHNSWWVDWTIGWCLWLALEVYDTPAGVYWTLWRYLWLTWRGLWHFRRGIVGRVVQQCCRLLHIVLEGAVLPPDHKLVLRYLEVSGILMTCTWSPNIPLHGIG